MSKTITALFETRRDADMAIEHIVQDHGLDRQAVSVMAATDRNSAGTAAAGADVEDGHGGVDETARPALAGRIRVTVEVDDATVGKVRDSFSTYGGTEDGMP